MVPLALTAKSHDDDYVVTCPRCLAEVNVQPEGITFRVGGQPADKPRRTATFACLGPIDPVTDAPGETCEGTATRFFYFAHRDGIAFMFACDAHALSLGQWAGIRFGGCWGGKVENARDKMREAATKVARADVPRTLEFKDLVRAPNAPKGSGSGRISPN